MGSEMWKAEAASSWVSWLASMYCAASGVTDASTKSMPSSRIGVSPARPPVPVVLLLPRATEPFACAGAPFGGVDRHGDGLTAGLDQGGGPHDEQAAIPAPQDPGDGLVVDEAYNDATAGGVLLSQAPEHRHQQHSQDRKFDSKIY